MESGLLDTDPVLADWKGGEILLGESMLICASVVYVFGCWQCKDNFNFIV